MATLTDRPPARADPPLPPPARRRPVRRRRSERRLLAVGMLVSVLVHGLVVVVASGVLVVPDPVRPPPSAGPGGATAGDVMRAINIVEVASADGPEAVPPEPREDQPPEAEPAVRTPPAATEAGADDRETVARQPMSAAERLEPRMGDRRLWASPSELAPPRRPTEMERARTRIAGRLNVLNDSIAAAMEAARRAREWTVEDEDGGKWGVSPGKLHLGDITLPLPISFPVSPRLRQRIGEWGAIRSQAAGESVREYLERRAKAIRERKDQQRDSTKSGTGGGGPGGSPPR